MAVFTIVNWKSFSEKDIKKNWIFEKIDDESIKNQNKLKIWVKNKKTLVSKYCTGSWINLDGYKIWLNQDDMKKVNWENEINELLKK